VKNVTHILKENCVFEYGSTVLPLQRLARLQDEVGNGPNCRYSEWSSLHLTPLSTMCFHHIRQSSRPIATFWTFGLRIDIHQRPSTVHMTSLLRYWSRRESDMTISDKLKTCVVLSGSTRANLNGMRPSSRCTSSASLVRLLFQAGFGTIANLLHPGRDSRCPLVFAENWTVHLVYLLIINSSLSLEIC
jgi:hypothetical protein